MEENNCIEEIATLEEVDVITTGGTGTNDYNKLENKPSINDIPLERNKTLDELGIQAKGDYITNETFAQTIDEISEDIEDVRGEIPDISNLSAGVDINRRQIEFLDTRVTKLEEGGQPSGDYATEEYVDEQIQELVDGDISNLTELITELQDVTTKGIYVGYINSVTPNRNNMEEIIKDAINDNASMIILRPTIDLPQNFVAISSGPNLQNYKDGGKGYMYFTDINEHSDSNEMPSVMSYTTKVTFTVTKNDDMEVTIDNVETDFVSGINSTSQHAYVLHTKNETEYTPTKDYHPSTKKYVDDSIKQKINATFRLEGTTLYITTEE